MDKKQYIHNLAILYFSGKINPAQEKELFEYHCCPEKIRQNSYY